MSATASSCAARRAPRSRRASRDALDLVQLGALGERYPAQLSGGQRQRVALARAIICRPRLILLDEPLAALDVELRRQMQVFLKSIQTEIRTTFLFVTHDQEEAIAMADRICVMNGGRIQQIGTPHEVYYRPSSEFVAKFFGENNLIPGTLGAVAGARRTIETSLGPILCSVEGQPDIAACPSGTQGLRHGAGRNRSRSTARPAARTASRQRSRASPLPALRRWRRPSPTKDAGLVHAGRGWRAGRTARRSRPGRAVTLVFAAEACRLVPA